MVNLYKRFVLQMFQRSHIERSEGTFVRHLILEASMSTLVCHQVPKIVS
jgi:hypothetical protein